MLQAPDVGGILGDHERQVPDDLHSQRIGLRAPAAPLLVGDPLLVAERLDLVAQLLSRAGQRLRLAVAQGRLPVAPALQPPVVQRAVHGPVREPVAVLLAEGGEGPRAGGPAAKLGVAETFPAAPQRRPLGGAHLLELDAIAVAVRIEPPLLLAGQLATEVLYPVQVDVHRLQRRRAGGGIRAVLARRDLVERQVLPHRRAAGAQPARHRSRVGIAAQPAARPADGGQRKEEPGAPAQVEAMSHDSSPGALPLYPSRTRAATAYRGSVLL